MIQLLLLEFKFATQAMCTFFAKISGVWEEIKNLVLFALSKSILSTYSPHVDLMSKNFSSSRLSLPIYVSKAYNKSRGGYRGATL